MVSKRISFDDGLERMISILTGGFTSILPAENIGVRVQDGGL